MDSRKLLLELVWWFLTAVIVAFVMFPIWKDYPEFRFNSTNIAYIVCFVTFARYTFLLKYTWIAHFEKAKIIFVLCTLAIIGFLLTQMQDFNVWFDAGDPDQLMPNVLPSKRESLLSFIRTEFLFFAVGAMVAAVFLAGRLLISVWTVRNRGRV